ncbi:MAG TPA: GNAT family N-acetyltransferase [Bryobacteraceae bacterium]|nr:GNAT family N-acetyltransferase [Bryobacteraceae bacterium]
MSAKIRRATRSDADFLAWVMLASSRSHVARGAWDLVVGADDAECLDYLKRLAVAEPRSLCHYESFLVADVDARPAAALCTFKPGDGGWAVVGQASSNVQRELGWTEADRARSQQRFAPMLACLPPDAGADWVIEFVATLPEYRRRGLADALMREAIQHGVERGCSLAQIMILTGNHPAQAAYEKAGFAVYDEHGSPELEVAIGAPGYRRLLRKL